MESFAAEYQPTEIIKEIGDVLVEWQGLLANAPDQGRASAFLGPGQPDELNQLISDIKNYTAEKAKQLAEQAVWWAKAGNGSKKLERPENIIDLGRRAENLGQAILSGL